MIHTQEQSITELLKAVREQSDQLNLQKVKIKILEEKVNFRDCKKITWRGSSKGGFLGCFFFFVFSELVPYIYSFVVSCIVKKISNC